MIKYWGLHKSNSMNLSTEHCYLKWKWNKKVKFNIDRRSRILGYQSVLRPDLRNTKMNQTVIAT